MQAKVARWGNSLALRLPKNLTSELGIQEDSLVEIQIVGGQMLVKAVQETPTLEELVAGITDENRHQETDWGAARGAELA
jgi:antitoxin MazE